MSELRDALDHIMRLCAHSRTYSRRVQVIHETAMRALGMTAGQRQERHVEIMERVGEKPLERDYLERHAKRMDRAMQEAA